MFFKNLFISFKNFIKSGLSDSGQISSKRGVLWYVAIILWTYVHLKVFRNVSMVAERASVIEYDFWIIVSATGMVLSEKFTKSKS